MSTTSVKPTPTELDHAKQIYNDVNDYLGFLNDLIQKQVQNFSKDSEDSEDSEDSDYEEELSPKVFQFLNDYKEYMSSLPQVHNQLVSNNDSSSSTTTSSKLRKRFWKYSHLQFLPPDLLGDLQKLCEAKLDRDVQASPLFSTSLPTLNNINNEKLLTNETSPSVTLLKAQLDKHTTRELERNRIVIRMPNYSFDEPIEEKKLVFVVKKSTAVIIAPPTAIEPPKEQEPIKGEIEEKSSTIDEKTEIVSEKVLSEKNTKKKTIDFDFLTKFLSTNKFGFSRSQLSQLSTVIWT